MMKKFILIITALVMIVSVAVQSHAQSFRDQTLFGRVLDEKGETLPGAMVASAAYYAIQNGEQPTDPYIVDISPRSPIK